MNEQRYILAKKIARGGMAEIYLGKHIGEDGFQRLCAIKRILPHYAQDQEFIQMFRDEAHICKRLQHANIVRVEGFEEVDGSYAIIMEFVDGCDLRSLLHSSEQTKRRLSIPMACYIVAESARGLHYAHSKVDEITQQPLGIVHRDISPQNLLISYEGEVKVTDFGIADAESKITDTRPGIVKGKYSYMSPEQISAKPVDARTDVFALCIVLWEMLAMRRLFQGANEVDTIQRVKNCKIEKDLKELNHSVDVDLETIVYRGLAKDPKKRFKSASELEKELRRYLSKNFADFTALDLGNFIKEVLNKKRAESAQEIKNLLTASNVRPSKRTDSVKSAIDLSLDEQSNQGPQITLAKSALHTRSNNNSMLGPPSSYNSRKPSPLNSQKQNQKMRRNTSASISDRRLSPVLLMFVASLTLILGGIFFYKAPATSKAEIILRTQPVRVRISVNNDPVNKGHYVNASSEQPVRLTVKPGDYILKVERPGYDTFVQKVRLKDGEVLYRDDIVLKEKTPLAAIRLRTSHRDEAINVDIDQGYYIGAIRPGRSPILSPDLPLGREYVVRVTTKSKQQFACRFQPNSANWKQPNVLIIDPRNQRCLKRNF